MVAKSGMIHVIIGTLVEELEARVNIPIDPSVDLSELIRHAYSPDATYSLEAYICALADMLNHPGVKAKTAK